MFELINEYIKYLSALKQIVRPKMPKISPEAYTDNEYLFAMGQIDSAFDNLDSVQLTERFLKGLDGNL